MKIHHAIVMVPMFDVFQTLNARDRRIMKYLIISTMPILWPKILSLSQSADEPTPSPLKVRVHQALSSSKYFRNSPENSEKGFTCGDMYQDLIGSKVVIKQRASLMDRHITILEQSKYEEFKAICEGPGIFHPSRCLLFGRWSLSGAKADTLISAISHYRRKCLPVNQALWWWRRLHCRRWSWIWWIEIFNFR